MTLLQNVLRTKLTYLHAVVLILLAVVVIKIVVVNVPELRPAVSFADIGTTTAYLAGAGDIADCMGGSTAKTAALIDPSVDVVFTLGDNVYFADPHRFSDCFAPWGVYKEKIHPAIGNHEYDVPGAADYFTYFGAQAGERGKGYYSYDVGGWHVVVLNSQCEEVGGCAANSPQGQWLTADLTKHPTLCTLAYWHHPLFNSGNHGSTPSVRPLWEILERAGADVILTGHAHNYERFAPQTASGLYSRKGIREFVVGTGGKPLLPAGKPEPNSEAINTSAHGILKLWLAEKGYRFEFAPVAGESFTDRGADLCH